MLSFFRKTIEHKITDDSGFLAIVNAEQYHSFVDKDWDFEQLKRHFLAEMNNDHLIIWATGLENIWQVSLSNKPSNKKSFREFSKSIQVTNEQLYLTNYEDLTMVAQFEDEALPLKHNTDLVIKLDNGKYNFTIRQMFNPDGFDFDATDQINFEIIFQPTSNTSKLPVNEIFWMAD